MMARWPVCLTALPHTGPSGSAPPGRSAPLARRKRADYASAFFELTANAEESSP